MKHAATRRIGTSAIEVTRLGYGGTALAGAAAPGSEACAAAVVETALAHGIRYFDTSPFYGSGISEHRLGTGLRAVQRADVIVSTKVGRLLVPDATAAQPGVLPFRPIFDYSHTGTVRSYEDSLQRLGMDRIDLVIIHDVSHRWHGERFSQALSQALEESLPALIELRQAGLVGAIGLGTNDLAAAVPMAEYGGLDCIMIAREYNLLNHADLLRDLSPICVNMGISLLCAAPFASGILATGLNEGATYMYAPPDDVMRAKVADIQAVCAQYDTPLAAAALQFPDRNPLFSSVVAGLRSKAEITAAIEAFNHPIPDAFWQHLKSRALIDPSAPTKAPSAKEELVTPQSDGPS